MTLSNTFITNTPRIVVEFGFLISNQRSLDERALRRARRLLLSRLTPVQKQQLKKHGEFGVIGDRGGRYVVDEDGGIHKVTHPKGYIIFYCYEPIDRIPMGDRVLAAKWFIESNERRVQRRAVPSRSKMWEYGTDAEWRAERARLLALTEAVLEERTKSH